MVQKKNNTKVSRKKSSAAGKKRVVKVVKKTKTAAGKPVKKTVKKSKAVKTRAKKTTVKKTAKKSEVFDINHLLIDEQISYSKAVNRQLRSKQKEIEPVINQLDELIYGEIQKTPVNSEKINLKKESAVSNGPVKVKFSGEAVVKKNVHPSLISDSGYTLDLREELKNKSAAKTVKHQTTFSFQNNSLYNSFRVKSSKLEVPRLSLIKKNYLKELPGKLKSLFTRKDSLETKKDSRLGSALPSAPMWQSLKTALNFALVALLFIIPIKGYTLYNNIHQVQGQVLGVTEEAVSGLKDGLTAISLDDWSGAGFSFSQASDYFAQAQQVLQNYNQSLFDVISGLPVAGKKLADGKRLLKAGEIVSRTATDFSQLFSKVSSGSDLKQTITQTLPEFQQSFTLLKDDLNETVDLLSAVDPSNIPEDYRDTFIQLQDSLPVMLSSFQQAEDFLNFTVDLLGYQQPKRYLFIFQNNNELRPTGGFMGSFALVDVKNGEIINLEVPGGGFYDLKGDFFEKIIAPEPFHLLGTSWQIWNANWWPDFPTSAKKIEWFFEKSGWPTVDGVMAVNATVLPKILEIVGPVSLPEYDQLLTSDNVILALQHEVEFEYDKTENQPKKIIGDLMPIMIDRLFSIESNQLLPLVLSLNQSFKNKDIQFYFNSEQLQQQAGDFGLTGEIAQTNQDYLMVTRANIAGGKTDLSIKESVKHYVYLQEDGSLINTVAVTLTHQGNPDDVFERVQNNSYLRIYVPEGSQLIEASGADVIDQSLFKEIYEGYQSDKDLLKISGQTVVDSKSNTFINNELGKTVFGSWVQLEPGDSKTLTYSYKLPFKLNFSKTLKGLQKSLASFGLLNIDQEDGYRLIIQNQSGVKNVDLESRLYLPKGFSAEWQGASRQESLEKTDDYIRFRAELDSDLSYGALINK